MCPPPLLLITKVSEDAWSSTHLNIFFSSFFSFSPFHLLGGACPQGLESCLCPPAGECVGKQPTVAVLFHGLALKINYTAEVRGKNKGQSVCVRASGQPHGALGECADNGIYHRGGRYTSTRSGCYLSLLAPKPPLLHL